MSQLFSILPRAKFDNTKMCDDTELSHIFVVLTNAEVNVEMQMSL